MHHQDSPFGLQPLQDHLSLQAPPCGGQSTEALLSWYYHYHYYYYTDNTTKIIPQNPSQQAGKAEIQPQKSNTDLTLVTFCVPWKLLLSVLVDVPSSMEFRVYVKKELTLSFWSDRYFPMPIFSFTILQNGKEYIPH